MKSKFLTQLLLLVLVCIGFSFATDVYPQSAPDAGQTKKPVAYKVSELVNERGNEIYMAFLDEYADKLSKAPKSMGVIITYGPEGEPCGSAEHLLKEVMDYMGLKGFNSDRILAINGGQAKSLMETATELWIVPPGAKPPKPETHQIDLSSFVGMIGSRRGAERLDEPYHEAPSPGDVTLAAFAEILHHQPNSIGYLVSFPTQDSSLGAWRRIGQYDLMLLKSYGISADRVKIVHGGTDEDPLEQFWVLPKGEPLPVKEAPPDQLGKEAVAIQGFFEYDLVESDEQDFAFKAIADLLKEYPESKVCYMIMPPWPEEDKPKEFELPRSDFHQIVEKWRSKFINDLKINPNRIVIMYPTGVDESFFGTMDSWIVPKNAVLPSPPKVNDDPSTDDPPPNHR